MTIDRPLIESHSPSEVAALHQNSDVDSGELAYHHTLGPRGYQAAPGNHKHNQSPAGDWAPNVRNFNDAALAHALQLAKFKINDGVCHWWLNVTINANGVNFVKFDLPSPVNPVSTFGGIQYPVGYGRENTLGNMCQVLRHVSGSAAVILYNNGNTAVNTYVLLLSGSYLTEVAP